MTIKTTFIDYCIEPEDLNCDSDEQFEKEKAEILKSLPQIFIINIDDCEPEDLDDIVVNEITERSGWLINSVKYEVVK